MRVAIMGEQMSETTTQRAEYEAPTITDFGAIEEITQGNLKVNIQDFPLGAPSAILPVLSGLPHQGPRG